MITIRAYTSDDWNQLWAVLQPVFSTGDTYPYPPDITKAAARKIWADTPQQTFVAVTEGGDIQGSYSIKPNQMGQGDHVCNASFVTAIPARGQGIARAMAEHAQTLAVTLGYTAMQFNYVVASNKPAVALWQKLGFSIIGTVPAAFRHPQLGPVSAHIMYKKLRPEDGSSEQEQADRRGDYPLRDITPYFTSAEPAALISFATDVLGAELYYENHHDDGTLQHARLRFGDSVVMLNQSTDAYDAQVSQMHLYVPDCRAAHTNALEAGAISIMEPNLRPHGDWMAGITDPTGNIWWLAERG